MIFMDKGQIVERAAPAEFCLLDVASGLPVRMAA